MNYSERVIKTYFNKSQTKEKDWYKEKVESLMPTTYYQLEDYDEMKLGYEIYNDDLTQLKAQYTKMCDPLGIKDQSYTPTPYPVLHNKINVLKGEMLQRQTEYGITSYSDKVLTRETELLKTNIKQKIQESVERFTELMKQKLEGQVPPEQFEQQMQQLIDEEERKITPEDLDIKNYQSEVKLFFQAVLRYCLQSQDVKRKKVNSLLDIQAANRMFVYSGWKHGKPFLEERNTLYVAFHKSGSEYYVNKGEYIYYRQARTINDILQDWETYLTEDEIDVLKSQQTLTTNKNHSVINSKTKAKPVFNTFDQQLAYSSTHPDKHVGNSKTSASTSFQTYDQLIWETHVEFKELESVYFLSYEDELGEKVTVVVDNKFDIPKSAIKSKKENRFGTKTNNYSWVEDELEYTVEEVKVPVKHECIILNDNIYVIARKVPHQIISAENPYENFNLSTFGTVINTRNARSISPIQRVLPLYLQYIFIKDKQNKEIAKYKGYIQNADVDQIPTSLGQDNEGNDVNDPVKVWLSYLDQGLNLYSGSQTTNNLPPPPTRAPGSTAYVIGVANEIFTLQNLLQLIEQEIGTALGISPQREARYETNSNASDNRQALVQSYNITEPYMEEIDEVWRQAVYDYIKNFKTYCQIKLERNEKVIFDYTLPDGSLEVFEVKPGMLNFSFDDLGLYLKSNSNRKEYNNYMLAQVQAFAQNAGEGVEAVSQIIHGITSGSTPDETNKMIAIRNKQIRQQQEQQQQKEQEHQMQLLEEQKKLSLQEHQQELEKIQLKATLDGEYQLKQEQIKQQTAINTTVIANKEIQ